MQIHTRAVVAIMMGMPLLVGPSSAIGTPTFHWLGDLPGKQINNVAYDVSSDGSAVVGTTFYDEGSVEAFRWTKETGFTKLGDLPGGDFKSQAYSVSADGSVVVGKGRTASGDDAFRWTAGSGLVNLGAGTNEATAVSADGQVVAGDSFRWTSGTGAVPLAGLPGGFTHSKAWSLSGDGSVMVGQCINPNTGEFQAFRWTEAGGMVGLGSLSGLGFYSRAMGVSEDGAVVVGSTNSTVGTEPFRWTENSDMVGLGLLPASTGGEAKAVSGDGSTIVGHVFLPTGPEAFYWTSATGMIRLQDLLVDTLGLDLDSGRLSTAYSVSANGLTIVGVGDHDGNSEAWIATIPEPCSAVLLALGALATLRRCSIR